MKKPKNKKGENKEQIVKEIAEDVLKRLEIEGDFDLAFLEEPEKEIKINLNTKDTGIVIGYHGEILEALQLVLSLMISKKLGEFIRVSIDTGDYKKNREEYLKDLAFKTKERVLEENRQLQLSNLKSWERRIIHMMLKDDNEVQTESVGEGRERTLVVKPK